MKEILEPLRKERRITILRCLTSDDPKTFEEIRELTGISNGSLYEHLNVLVDLGYVHKSEERPARYIRDEYVDKLVEVAMSWRARKKEELEKRLAEYHEESEVSVSQGTTG